MGREKRRFFEGGAATPTFIGAESVFVGDLRCAGSLVVSGEVHGDAELGGCLHLTSGGSWHGFVRAHQAVVTGKITGGLTVKDKVEIGSTAVIRGSISAGSVAIAKGAILDGELVVTSGAPVHEFVERRTGGSPSS